MDDLIRESMEGFEDVWRRVTGRPEGPEADSAASPPPAPSREETLLHFIGEEACALRQSESLARMSRGEARAILLRHAAESRRRLRRLRAEYFIDTGDTDAGEGRCPMPAGALASLRELYLRAQALGEGYERAAANAGPDLAETYTAFAAEDRRRARELRALLLESF